MLADFIYRKTNVSVQILEPSIVLLQLHAKVAIDCVKLS